ncbi:MAG TPA: carboxynorspermidine decarboxylase [Candidatus Hydrogenedentes bacterium]|nr:carboxynorspermidine decarboxylase [Candidatus Hydrogenedentota bacterium]
MLPLDRLSTPCYVTDAALLQRNLDILDGVQQCTGCKILLALKGFAMWNVFPDIRKVLHGIAASSLHEAQLGREEFNKEVHVYAPAYRGDEFDTLVNLADHIIFNSFSQWKKFRGRVKSVECGLRVNPEHSEVAVKLYDPCAPGSRLGIRRSEFDPDALDGISGLHFHTLCELNSDALERTLPAFEQRFGMFIPRMRWINFGGGHHITRPDYDVDRLCRIIHDFKERHPVTVYLEPGEAIALNTGFLVASVLDIVHNEMDIAILDTSAAAHMPDVLEMPYRPRIEGAGQPGELPHTFRLGGLTCLAGDVIGDYSFPQPLKPGDKLVFHDMAHYTMVKNTTFNGVRLPDIVLYDSRSGDLRTVRQFTYSDYKTRLGGLG